MNITHNTRQSAVGHINLSVQAEQRGHDPYRINHPAGVVRVPHVYRFSDVASRQSTHCGRRPVHREALRLVLSTRVNGSVATRVTSGSSSDTHDSVKRQLDL